MAEDVSDLVVRVHPEGAEETQEVLKDTRGEFEQTAGDVGESAGLMSDFSKKFQGAGLVFAGAFGTMVAAIVSKMPIIQESASALDAVLTGLGLRFDSLTRDRLTPLNLELFELADALAMKDDVDALGAAFGVVNRVLDAFPAAATALGLDGIASAARTAELVLENDLLPSIEDLQIEIDDFSTTSFVDGLVNAFTSVVDDGIDLFKEAMGGIGSWLTQQFTDAKNVVINTFINPVIDGLNEAINLANQLPGVDLNNIGRVGTLPVPGINDPGGTRGPGGFTQSQARQRRQAQAGGSQVDRVIGALENARVEHVTQLNGREISKSVEKLLASGASDIGRVHRGR